MSAALLEKALMTLPVLSEAQATSRIATAIDLHTMNPTKHKQPRLVMSKDPGPGMMLDVFINPLMPTDFMVLNIGHVPVGRILINQTQETPTNGDTIA